MHAVYHQTNVIFTSQMYTKQKFQTRVLQQHGSCCRNMSVRATEMQTNADQETRNVHKKLERITHVLLELLCKQ